MVIQAFPPLDLADEHGLLAVGGDLEVRSLLLAYQRGIFPWPVDEEHLTWFSPPLRAVLFLEDFRINRTLSKFLRKHEFSIRVNYDFPAVISACQDVSTRGSQQGTWITEEMRQAYIAFHRAGFAHSIEAYSGQELVGGLYGVAVNGMFAGESMFYRRPNASKLCLCFLKAWLEKHGIEWFDCQVITPLLQSLGAAVITRKQFTAMLEQAAKNPVAIFPQQSIQVGVWRGEKL